MKTKEQIREKIAIMEEDLKKYKEDFNNLEKYVTSNGYKRLEEDTIFITINNQITALKWVLKDR